MSEALFEQAAYHESGHIVLAYTADFACTGVSLNAATPGEAWTRMDYGEDITLATAILISDSHPEVYNTLPRETKAPSPNVANRLCHMLCGGPLAEAWHKHGVQFKGKLEVEMQGPDLIRVKAIDQFLTSILKERHPRDYVDKTLALLAEVVRSDEFWITIRAMAAAILAAPNRTLDRAGIETVLNQSGFLDFVNSKR